jgi:hypothetical protein
MSEAATCVLDTNVLLNLATPVVDGRDRAPDGADPLKTVLVAYDVHVPESVVGEVSDAAAGEDLLAAAATLVLRAAAQLETHDVTGRIEGPLEYGLDRGESEAIWLANDLGSELFVTDEFGTTSYLFVSLAIEDRNTLFTTPHLLCALAAEGTLPRSYADAAVTYYAETKGWDGGYVERLRERLLTE